MSVVCRTCLQRVTALDAISLFQIYKQKYKLVDILKQMIYIKIEFDDDESSNLSKSICEKCANQMVSFYNFAEMVIISDQKLNESIFKPTFLDGKLLQEPNVTYEIRNEQHTVFLNMPVVGNELIEEMTDNDENTYGQDDYNVDDDAAETRNYLPSNCDEVKYTNASSELDVNGGIQSEQRPKISLIEKPYTNEEASHHCPDCYKSYETKSGLKKHRQNIHNYGRGDPKRNPRDKNNCTIRHCPQCLKLFETMSGLRKHLKNVHKTDTLPIIKCKFCSEKLYLNSDLDKHIFKCHPDLDDKNFNSNCDRYIARKCTKYQIEPHRTSFTSRLIDIKHMNIDCKHDFTDDDMAKEIMHLSTSCEKDLDANVLLEQNPRKDSFEKSITTKETFNGRESSQEQHLLQCPDCIKYYETASGLRKHRQNIHNHGGGKKKLPKDRNACTVRHCHECSKLFQTMSGLRKHLINAHKTNALPVVNCTFCSEKFYLNTDLEKHVLKSHQDRNESYNNVRWHCGACGKRFRTRTTLHDHRLYTGHKTPRRPHIRSAKRENGTKGNFQCDICKRFYTTKRKIRHHMEIHYAEKRKQKFLCTVCGIWLSSNHILQSHYRAIHLGEKPFKCAYCERLFSSRQELKQHTNRHEGIRPHSCKQCPRTFFVRTNLKEHMESIHLNRKRHICTVCNKAFNRKGNLKLHTYTHTRQSPHQCPTCGAGFSRKYKLIEHVEHCKN